jgi:predicted nucleic acid-binding protein
MSDRTFLDTNVLVYAIDDAEPAKQEIAKRALASSNYGRFTVSAQVLGEFYVTVTRRLAKPLSTADAMSGIEHLDGYGVVPIDAALVNEAISTSRSAQISYWDGLIVAAAERAGCERLLTEDLNDGQLIGSVRVENPFRELVS